MIRKSLRLALFLYFCLSAPSYGAFFMLYNLNYQSETDANDTSALASTRTMHNLFFGASVDKNNQLYLGQNILSWTKSVQQGSDSNQLVSLSLLELGPRLHYYFSDSRTWFVSATYNFQSKGSGTLAGQSGTLTGTGTMATIGYHYKVTKVMGIGASLTYHSTTITSRKVGSTTSDVSETYTSMIPMLEFAWRFR